MAAWVVRGVHPGKEGRINVRVMKGDSKTVTIFLVLNILNNLYEGLVEMSALIRSTYYVCFLLRMLHV
jgi:hypothetical protein